MCIAYKGRTIGIGAGQQSRIDCVKLARRKAEIYLLRNNKSITDIYGKKFPFNCLYFGCLKS